MSTIGRGLKVEGKRLDVSPFSGFDLYHHFRNDAFHDLYNLLNVRKTGKQEVVFLQPLPQTLYQVNRMFTMGNNEEGQLGQADTVPTPQPQTLNLKP